MQELIDDNIKKMEEDHFLTRLSDMVPVIIEVANLQRENPAIYTDVTEMFLKHAEDSIRTLHSSVLKKVELIERLRKERNT